MEHERPKALFTLAAEQLHVGRIARPSVDQLVRLISAAREARAQGRPRGGGDRFSRPRRAG
jgi:hypothetical protein